MHRFYWSNRFLFVVEQSSTIKPFLSKQMAGQTVCVTGASGFIASWLVKLLLERDYTVRGTIRSPGTSRDFVSFYSFPQCRCLPKLGEHK